jgi:Ankyrin repeats (3 copies)
MLHLRFHHDGKRIDPSATPQMLELRDMDQIDVSPITEKSSQAPVQGGSDTPPTEKPTNPNNMPNPAVITPQLKEPPNPATVSKQLFKELNKTTTDWDKVHQWARECPDVCKEKFRDGSLPLHCACKKNAPLDVIQFLVETWPDAVKDKEKNKCGELPLHWVFSSNSPLDVIQLLVETWPDTVKEKNNNGSLPLHYACHYNAPLDVMQFLVKMWPNAVKAKNRYGFLPLHYACFHNAPLDVIQLLVETWPNAVKEKNKDGNTPLALAKNAGAGARTISWLEKHV